MSRFLNFLTSFFFSTDHSAEEAYLADAADLYDLERRQRLLDQQRPVYGF